ncbi:MAG: hypothetical protein JNK21_01800 [Rhodospirillaceae bacterium]|nr:hypothetical protein [Rhodospirillaceae bacterium]
MTAAAISADFVDTKRIKGRKVLQIVCEVALEQEQRVMEALGWPNPASGLPVAIARIQDIPQGADGPTDASCTSDKGTPSNTSAKGSDRRSFREMPRSQQAALKLSDRDFCKWLVDTNPDLWNKNVRDRGIDVLTPSEILYDAILKDKIGIASKKELDTNPDAAGRWDRLLTDYDMRSYGECRA